MPSFCCPVLGEAAESLIMRFTRVGPWPVHGERLINGIIHVLAGVAHGSGDVLAALVAD